MLTIESKHSLDPDSGKFILIPGPCSVDSERLARYTVEQASLRGIDTVRMDLYKPRTSPFEADGSLAYVGAREAGLPWLRMALEEGVTPATEVLIARQAETVLNAVANMPNRRLMLWHGARNTNHDEILEIASLIKGEDWVTWGFKSPWSADSKAWKGLIDWASSIGGVDKNRLLMIYRGLPVRGSSLRSDPFWDDAETQKVDGVRMLLDTSHMSKDRQQIFDLAQEGLDTGLFDGAMIEVHPWPNWHEPSKTDPGITFDMLDVLDIPQPLTLVRQLNGLHTEQRVHVGV